MQKTKTKSQNILDNNLEKLYIERQKAISENKFNDAIKYNNNIHNLLNTSMITYERELKRDYDNKLTDYENEKKLRLKEFKEKWKNEFINFNEYVNKSEKELEAYIQEEKQSIIDTEKDKSQNLGTPPEYLNLMKIKNVLIKQEKYKDAERIQKLANNIITEKKRKIKLELDKKLMIKLNNLSKKEKQFRTRFKDKITAEKRNMEIQKNKEYSSIINQFRVKKLGIELKWKNQRLVETNKISILFILYYI